MISDDLTVYGYHPFGELSDMSPFVAKLEAYLSLAGVPYTKRTGSPREAPRGKLPFIEHRGQRVTDSAAIVRYLADAGLADLDATLSPGQRAELTAIGSMLELELYFILAWSRWINASGWAIYRPLVLAYLRALGVPRVLAPLLVRGARRKLAGVLDGQGVGRRDANENIGRVATIFDALDGFAPRHGGPFWFGAGPTSADAIVYAFVSGMVVPTLGLGFESLLEPRAQLRAWFEHVDAALKPA